MEPTEKTKLEVLALRAAAVREAMLEVMNEQRAEIIRRAHAALKAKGIPVGDLEAHLGA